MIPPDTRALAGLTVVEVTEPISGAYCARLLADLGAEVIKVEPPQGDATRRLGPFPDDVPDPEESGLFLHLNANKLGITANLDTTAGRQVLRALLQQADVLIENVRLLKGDLSWEELHRLNPSLTITSISPYGLWGPYSDYKGDDLTLFNWSAFAWSTPGLPDTAKELEKEPPLAAGASVVGFTVGAVAAVGTMMSVVPGDGQGRHVEVSEYEAMVSLNYTPLMQYSYLRRLLHRGPNIVARQPNCYLPCKDGWVVLIAMTEPHWAALTEVMGNPDWAESEVFADSLTRSMNWDALEPPLVEWTMQYTGREITEMLQSRGVSAYWALTLEQAVNSEHTVAREFLMKGETPSGRPFRFPTLPLKLSRSPWHLERPAPRLGQHNADVLVGRLGYKPQDLAILRHHNAI